MAVRIHVIAARGLTAGELRAACAPARVFAAGEASGFAFALAPGLRTSGAELDAALLRLPGAALRATAVERDRSEWQLFAFAGGRAVGRWRREVPRDPDPAADAALADGLAAAGIPFDRAAVLAALAAPLTAEERASDLGDLPRFLAAIGLGAAFAERPAEPRPPAPAVRAPAPPPPVASAPAASARAEPPFLRLVFVTDAGSFETLDPRSHTAPAPDPSLVARLDERLDALGLRPLATGRFSCVPDVAIRGYRGRAEDATLSAAAVFAADAPPAIELHTRLSDGSVVATAGSALEPGEAADLGRRHAERVAVAAPGATPLPAPFGLRAFAESLGAMPMWRRRGAER